MNVALRRAWTQQQFFAWVEAQNERYEFDGFQPVSMVGGTANHRALHINIVSALRNRLRGTPCRAFGADAGVQTVGDAVRYPDALVTCSPVEGTARTIPGPVIVFEVISPASGRTDRIVKVREYAAVPSIRRYVIVESDVAGLTVLFRESGDLPWTAATLAQGDVLTLPEVGISVPIDEIYEDISLSPESTE